MSYYEDEFENQISWYDESTEQFETEVENYGFIEPALLAIITGLIGEISLLFITMHI